MYVLPPALPPSLYPAGRLRRPAALRRRFCPRR